MPHFEHPSYVVNNSVKTLVEKWGTPVAFKKNWAERETAPVFLTNELPEEKPAPCGQAQTYDTAFAASADAAWEWAERLGLADGIGSQEPVTGRMLFNLLRKYDAAR
jgi:hypothetical protein